MDTTGKSGWDKVGDYDWHIYTTVYKTESRIRITYCMDRELYSMLCSDLNGKEIKKKKRVDICTHTAASLCSTAETSTAL